MYAVTGIDDSIVYRSSSNYKEKKIDVMLRMKILISESNLSQYVSEALNES